MLRQRSWTLLIEGSHRDDAAVGSNPLLGSGGPEDVGGVFFCFGLVGVDV